MWREAEAGRCRPMLLNSSSLCRAGTCRVVAVNGLDVDGARAQTHQGSPSGLSVSLRAWTWCLGSGIRLSRGAAADAAACFIQLSPPSTPRRPRPAAGPACVILPARDGDACVALLPCCLACVYPACMLQVPVQPRANTQHGRVAAGPSVSGIASETAQRVLRAKVDAATSHTYQLAGVLEASRRDSA